MGPMKGRAVKELSLNGHNMGIWRIIDMASGLWELSSSSLPESQKKPPQDVPTWMIS